MTDTEGLVLKVLTTPANVNEVANLEEVLATSDLFGHIHLYRDRGYRSAKNEELIKSRKLRTGILHKARKRQP